MLVIDRSGSMGDSVGSGSATSKWDNLKSAVSSLVTSYDAQMRLGAAIFSSDGNCGAANIDVPLASAAGATVLTKLNAQGPTGNTPTAAALDTVIAKGLLNDATRANYVVLATDGQPNCTDTDVTKRITTLYNQTPSVKTFVIGMGDGTASEPDAAQLVGRRRPHGAHRRDALLPDELAGGISRPRSTPSSAASCRATSR